MPRTPKDDIRDDFINVFLNTEEGLAEDIVYFPVDPNDGVQRTIPAQVGGMSGGIRHEQHEITDERFCVVNCRRHLTLGMLYPKAGAYINWNGRIYVYDAVTGESADEFFVRFKDIDRDQVGHVSAMVG